MIPKIKALTDRGWETGHAYYWQGMIFIEQDPVMHKGISPEKVCVSTGLTDFCGDEIFEGDILCVEQRAGEVRWQQSEARFVVVFDQTEVIPLAKIKRTAFILHNRWDEVEG